MSEVLKKINNTGTDAELYFYRTSNGVGVDLIVDYKTHQDFVEIKSGRTFRPPLLKTVLDVMPSGQHRGYLFYRGVTITYKDHASVLYYGDFLRDYMLQSCD